MALVLRNKKYHLRREVPARFAPIESRKVVWLSLHTGDHEDAQLKAAVAWRQMLDGWQARLDGHAGEAEEKFAAARNLALRRGFRYLPVERVAVLPLEDRLARAEAINIRNGAPDRIEAAALSGIVREPGVTIEKALEEFWLHAASDLAGKSADQIRRWKNPKKKAVRNLVSVIGHKELAAITRADMVKFKDWWAGRLIKEGLVANSANKDLIHVAHVLRTANSRLGLGLEDHLDRVLKALLFKDDKSDERDRPPFSDKWIREKILAPGALDGLDDEARCIVLTMINTGARPSEIAGLLPEHIHLDGDVPHISVEAAGKTLKTAQSRRRIPLVGVSLAAMKECSKGFPTYRFKDKISDTVNHYLRENGLLETERHVFYSLRHAFEDRMIAAEFDDRMRRVLFGHKLDREKYGNGPTLEHMHEKLKGIAI